MFLYSDAAEFFIFLIFSMILFGAVGAAIGVGKARPLAGLLFGAFLGPIGWLLVALGPDRRPKCPACGGVPVKGARKCIHCGEPLAFDPARYERQKAAMAAAAHDAQDTIDCPSCGAPILESALHMGTNACPRCNAPFEVSEE